MGNHCCEHRDPKITTLVKISPYLNLKKPYYILISLIADQTKT